MQSFDMTLGLHSATVKDHCTGWGAIHSMEKVAWAHGHMLADMAWACGHHSMCRQAAWSMCRQAARFAHVRLAWLVSAISTVVAECLVMQWWQDWQMAWGYDFAYIVYWLWALAGCVAAVGCVVLQWWWVALLHWHGECLALQW